MSPNALYQEGNVWSKPKFQILLLLSVEHSGFGTFGSMMYTLGLIL